MKKPKYIVTHGGKFHADEVLAIAVIQEEAGKLPVFRREPTPEELSDPQVVVVDVGGQYDGSHNNWDHHQRGYAEERNTGDGYGVRGQPNPMASAGLIWDRYSLVTPVKDMSEDELITWHKRVDAMLFRGVDATDCGKAEKMPKGHSPTLSQIISWMYPADETPKKATVTRAFKQAVIVATWVLRAVCDQATAWVKARSVVLSAPVQSSVLQLDTYVPWQDHVFDRPDQANLLYVVFPSDRGTYNVQQIPKTPESFEGRKPLPETWAGLRNEELAKVTGVADAMFCHQGRFIAGAKSLDGALALARKAVEA